MGTGDEAFKSICRVLGPRAKKPTLGVQHAVEAGYLFKEHATTLLMVTHRENKQ